MKIIVAMDSFKGSLTAVQACTIVADALRAVVPDATVVTKPMADGGEGTAAALMAATGGEWIKVPAMGPLPDMRVTGGFVWLAETRTAIVEMALVSGLPLLAPAQQNPLQTTTYGTGQLIQAAAAHGAARILLAIGGSATVDGGVGAAQACGWSFLTADGREVPPGGGHLSEITRIIPPSAVFGPEVDVLCDVNNPLCGPRGAARTYGPQKGATPEMVETLEANLEHLARVVKEQLGRDIRDLPGAGAAGGLAAGAVAFLDAHLVSGIDEVMSCSRLAEEVADADWVITGEGKFDEQSLQGKVVSGVARLAHAAGAKVAVLAGQVRLPESAYRLAHIETAEPCMTDTTTLEEALANAEPLLTQAARRFTQTHLRR
ncbi:MAG: glycerate kinase [Sedimentisphaerales bacterium]|nr:glycerate kinase [Sedimentisphaerales bacterium]